MTDLRSAMDDPRRRNLAILAAAALVAILCAGLAIGYQSSLTAPRESPELFFPDLSAHVRQIAHIRVRSKQGTVDVVFNPEKTWVVASHDDYPASFDQVRQTIIGMVALTALERKTARKDWFHYVDLVAPENGGNGTEITLMDEKGGVIASVIAGKTANIGDPNGAVGLFVRHPGDTQSWLARSVFEPRSDAGDWLDKQVMSIDRERIEQADIDPASGPSYVVMRDRPSDADFKLVDLPKGRELAYDGAADGVGAAIVDFTFDDVKPARQFDFSDPHKAARIVTRTFDGLVVTVNVLHEGNDYWATVSAEGTKPDAAKEARDINVHANGWAYKLPEYKGVQFTTPLENLLKPVTAQKGR